MRTVSRRAQPFQATYKALMDYYHEDEANSKKTKTTNTGKDKKATPSSRNDEELGTTSAR
jgi:hypothetical protein